MQDTAESFRQPDGPFGIRHLRKGRRCQAKEEEGTKSVRNSWGNVFFFTHELIRSSFSYFPCGLYCWGWGPSSWMEVWLLARANPSHIFWPLWSQMSARNLRSNSGMFVQTQGKVKSHPFPCSFPRGAAECAVYSLWGNTSWSILTN